MRITSQAVRSLTLENVRTWAKSKNPGDILGLAVVSTDCPLARFCHEALGVRVNMQLTMMVLVDDPSNPLTDYVDLPRWATRFIYIVDTCFKTGEGITREQVLVALNDAEDYVAASEQSTSWLKEAKVLATNVPQSLKQPKLSPVVTAQLDAILAEANEKELVPA